MGGLGAVKVKASQTNKRRHFLVNIHSMIVRC